MRRGDTESNGIHGQEGRRGKKLMGKGGPERGKQGHAEGTGGVH